MDIDPFKKEKYKNITFISKNEISLSVIRMGF
jgi:hypothetical protein